MIATLILDQNVDLRSVHEEDRGKITWVNDPKKNKSKAVFPKGTQFTGDKAIRLVKTGQAIPFDDECKVACGMTDAQVKTQGVEYRMDQAGIRDDKDRDLCRGGAIIGYDKDGKYIPGPTWKSYQDSLAAEDSKDEI